MRCFLIFGDPNCEGLWIWLMGQSDRGEQPHLQPTSFAPRPLPSSCSYCRGEVERKSLNSAFIFQSHVGMASQILLTPGNMPLSCSDKNSSCFVLLRISLEIIFLQDPGAWWMGQIVSYLLRPRQDLKVYSLVPSLFLSFLNNQRRKTLKFYVCQ